MALPVRRSWVPAWLAFWLRQQFGSPGASNAFALFRRLNTGDRRRPAQFFCISLW